MRISDWSSDVCSSDLVQTLHALGGRDAQDANAAFFGKLLEFGNTRNTCLQRAIDNTDDGVSATGLWNIVQLWYGYTRALRQQRQSKDRKSTRLNSSH